MKTASTRDKMIWFKHKVENNTVHFTQGCNEIVVSRENILQDSIE